jgi:hypothetical protein
MTPGVGADRWNSSQLDVYTRCTRARARAVYSRGATMISCFMLLTLRNSRSLRGLSSRTMERAIAVRLGMRLAYSPVSASYVDETPPWCWLCDCVRSSAGRGAPAHARVFPIYTGQRCARPDWAAAADVRLSPQGARCGSYRRLLTSNVDLTTRPSAPTTIRPMTPWSREGVAPALGMHRARPAT